MDISSNIEHLSKILPDPFFQEDGLTRFYNDPKIKEIYDSPQKNSKLILVFLEKSDNPTLCRTASLVLVEMSPHLYYKKFLHILSKSDMKKIEAFESSFWLFSLPEEKKARDIIRLVKKNHNPYPMLLLQRPAAMTVKKDIINMIVENKEPFNLYALYCLEYILQADDKIILQKIIDENNSSYEVVTLAKNFLDKIGTKDEN